MLEWFRRRFLREERPAAARRATAQVRVVFDDEAITVRPVSGQAGVLAWSEVGRVTIVTNDSGPLADDLYWIIQARDPRRYLTLPMGADGEHELLHAMQERLTGFDNMAVVEAMGSAENASFLVWDVDRKSEPVEE